MFKSAIIKTYQLNLLQSAFLFSFFTLCGFKAIGQEAFSQTARKLDGDLTDESSIRSQLISLSKTDQINYYFKQVIDTLKKDNEMVGKSPNEDFSNYCVKNLTQPSTACSLLIRENGLLRKAIAINVDYYYPKVSQDLQKAMFIWIIGHEIKHLQLGTASDENQLKGITNELLCDEMGGYLIGRILNESSFSEIDSILRNIIADLGNSTFTVERKYRIYAAEAGWLRGKTYNSQFDNLYSSKNFSIRKTGDGISQDLLITFSSVNKIFDFSYRRATNGTLYIGNSTSKGQLDGDGMTLIASNNSDSFSNIYLGSYSNGVRNGPFRAIWDDHEYEGNYAKNAKDGRGKEFWYSGDKKGQKYEGFYKDDRRDGFGIFSMGSDDSSTIYLGEWKNNLKDGRGVLYSSEKVIQSGCWSNDAYVNGDCK